MSELLNSHQTADITHCDDMVEGEGSLGGEDIGCLDVIGTEPSAKHECLEVSELLFVDNGGVRL